MTSSPPAFVERYLKSFETTWDDASPIASVRFVVLDCETTGLDPKRDRLISIGAVVVQGGEILLEDVFEATLKVAHNAASVLVHGITRDETRDALDEPEALEGFLGYLRDGVIVGHHIGHDVTTLNVACDRHWGFQLRNRFMDTMDLALHLERSGAFAGQGEFRQFSLDALCARFAIKPHDRHTAPGDAFITAQVFLKLLRLAERHDRATLGRVSEHFEPEDVSGRTSEH